MFDRTVNECNFHLGDVLSSLHANDMFNGCGCENLPLKVGDVYDHANSNMLRLLCSKVAGLPFSGGAWKRAHVKRAKKRMRGGVGPSPFMSDGFVDFISQRLLQQVAAIRTDIESACLFYDDADEIADGSSSNIVVWYDFEDYASSMFQLDAATVFGAYAASTAANRTPEQSQCMERFAALEQALMQAVVALA
jgi:hypothetical protein